MSVSDNLDADIDLEFIPKNDMLHEMKMLSTLFNSADKVCPVAGCGFGMAGSAKYKFLHRVLSVVHVMQNHDVRLYDFGVGGGNVIGHANWVFGWVATGCELSHLNVSKAEASLKNVAKSLLEASERMEHRCPSLIRRFRSMSAAERQPPPIDCLVACKENLGIMKARIAQLQINTFFVFWAGWSPDDKHAVLQLYKEAPTVGVFVIGDFTGNVKTCKELAKVSGARLMAAGSLSMAGSNSSAFTAMVFCKTHLAMVQAQQAHEAQEAEDAEAAEQGLQSSPAQTQEHENGLQAGSQSAVRGSKAIALALLNTNAARKSRCRDSPSSLHVKPASRLLQPSRTEQARKASLRAKAAAGVRKHGPVRRKRVPKCGACATCLHPHWKKACIVNQQKATAGTGAAAPGAGPQLRGSRVLSLLPQSQTAARRSSLRRPFLATSPAITNPATSPVCGASIPTLPSVPSVRDAELSPEAFPNGSSSGEGTSGESSSGEEGAEESASGTSSNCTSVSGTSTSCTSTSGSPDTSLVLPLAPQAPLSRSTAPAPGPAQVAMSTQKRSPPMHRKKDVPVSGSAVAKDLPVQRSPLRPQGSTLQQLKSKSKPGTRSAGAKPKAAKGSAVAQGAVAKVTTSVKHCRVPKCGTCGPCLHPAWKQACTVNRRRQEAGLPPVVRRCGSCKNCMHPAWKKGCLVRQQLLGSKKRRSTK